MKSKTKNDNEGILQLSCPTGKIERNSLDPWVSAAGCYSWVLKDRARHNGPLVDISLKKSASITAKGYVAMLASTEAFCKGDVGGECSSTSCVFTDPDHSVGGYSSWGANDRVSTPLTTAGILSLVSPLRI